MSNTESEARRRARNYLAASFAALGPAYANLAGLIRTPSYESFWVSPALDAMTALVLLLPDADLDHDPEN